MNPLPGSASLELGQHLNSEELFFTLMSGIGIGVRMDDGDTVNYVSMRKQSNPAGVPDEQQREKSIYEY